jgi:hypothetical protein
MSLSVFRRAEFARVQSATTFRQTGKIMNIVSGSLKTNNTFINRGFLTNEMSGIKVKLHLTG